MRERYVLENRKKWLLGFLCIQAWMLCGTRAPFSSEEEYHVSVLTVVRGLTLSLLTGLRVCGEGVDESLEACRYAGLYVFRARSRDATVTQRWPRTRVCLVELCVKLDGESEIAFYVLRFRKV